MSICRYNIIFAALKVTYVGLSAYLFVPFSAPLLHVNVAKTAF